MVTKSVIAILQRAYPIGCIYFSTNSTNPATSLGFGTWTAFGAGRVPVGFDSGQTEFDTDEETGGAKTHTLTTAEMPSHTHTQDAHLHTVSGVRGGINWTGGGSRALDPDVGGTQATSSVTATNQNTGGGGAHNNLQPYIVVRMWKRTA